MKKTYISPEVITTSSAMESQLCSTSTPEGNRNSVFGFEGEHGNAEWINEGQDNPSTVSNTQDDDDFDSQAKKSSMIWDEW